MRSGVAHNGEVELFWFDEGDPTADAVVLVNGAGSTAVMWCRELIDPLLAAGLRVVRFDNRDVGRSTRMPADADYTIPDLADDLAAVLDDLGVATAHLLGRSMGGMTIMQFAATRPERVRTMTLIYTTPAFADAGDLGLPGPQEHVLEAMAEAAFEPPPTTDAERIERRVKDTHLYVGTRYPVDEAWVRVRRAENEVLFTGILGAGEHFELPAGAADPNLRAGNAGSVYIVVDGEAFGPLGDGPEVAKGVQLTPDAVRSTYPLATDIAVAPPRPHDDREASLPGSVALRSE